MLQNFALLKTGVDVFPLLSALEKKPHLFDQITKRQTTAGSPHRDTRSIFLRWAKSQTLDAVFNEIPAESYPALNELRESVPLIMDILKLAGSYELGRVLITELKAGGEISPHADEGKVADYYERFHLALQSDVGNIFASKTGKRESEHVHMKPGEIYWFNHKRVHWLKNESVRPRIHLIVDCVSPMYRRCRDALSA